MVTPGNTNTCDSKWTGSLSSDCCTTGSWFFFYYCFNWNMCVPRSVVSDSLRPHGQQPARLLCPWNSPGKNTGVACHSLLQGIFPTPGLLRCRQILYCLSRQGSIVYLQCCVSFQCIANSIIQVHTHTCTHYFSDFSHYRSLQDTEYSSLCYTVGPCCLFHIY